MNYISKDTVTQFFSYRPLLIASGVMVLVMIGMLIYVATTLHPSEIKIVTHYSAFGVTHFYRDQWVYLVSFAAYAVIAAITTVLLSLKLVSQARRQLAIGFTWAGTALIVIAWLTYARIAAFI